MYSWRQCDTYTYYTQLDYFINSQALSFWTGSVTQAHSLNIALKKYFLLFSIHNYTIPQLSESLYLSFLSWLV